MAGDFSVKIGETVVNIKKGDSIEDVKKKLGDKAELIFDGFSDEGTNGVLDTENELTALKGKFAEHQIEIQEAEAKQQKQVAPDGKTPKNAYAKAIDNMKNSYGDDLTEYFDASEDKKRTIQKGDTLWAIAVKALKEDGFENPSQRDINNRIAQIARLNNINNVNNIRVGTVLVVRLNDAGKAKIEADENKNSAVALGSSTAVAAAQKAKEAEQKQQTQSTANKAVEKEGEGSVQKAPEGFVSNLEDSPFTVTANGLNMGKGIPVDAEGNELKREEAFKKGTKANEKFKADGAIMKYKKGDKVMYQITYSNNSKTSVLRGVKLYAESIEELKKMEADIKAEAAKIKKVEGDTDEAKAAVVQANVAALRAIITASNGNSKVIENAVKEYLQADEYMDDFKSEDVKSLTKDLLLTKDAGVVGALMTNNALFENDETAIDTAAQMFRELRQRELNGEKLSKEENKLKETLAGKAGAVFFAETEEVELGEGENKEKVTRGTEKRFDADGNTYFYATVMDGDDRYAKAETKDALDTFWREFYEAASVSDEEKALVKKYAEAETFDKYIAEALIDSCLGDIEDKKILINKCGMDVLSDLDTEDMDDDVAEAVKERVKQIYTESDAGNLDNARYLSRAFSLIKLRLSGDEAEKLKKDILDSYFEKTEVENEETGDKEVKYTFNPSRRPTKEEMDALINIGLSYEQISALKDYVKFEDMGEGQYTEALEQNFYMNGKYAEFVENLETVDDALDFIKNMYSDNRCDSIPFDKLIDKFKDDENFPKLARVLVKDAPYYNYEDSYLSDENRLRILNVIIPKGEDGKVKFDKSKLPEGIDFEDIVWILPTGCKDGEAKMYFESVVKQMGPSEILKYATNLKSKGSVDFIKKHVENVCKDQMKKNYKFPYDLLAKGSDNSFKDIIPWNLYADKLGNINKVIEGMDNEQKSRFAANLVSGLSDANRLKLVNKNADTFVKNALVEYHYQNGGDELYKKMVSQGFITELGDGNFVYDTSCYTGDHHGSVVMKKDDKGKVSKVTYEEFAENLYKNVDKDDDKPRQIAYAKALADMKPDVLARHYYAYFDVGGEGLLEALDFEANGASMSEFVPIIAKIAIYAIGLKGDNKKVQEKYDKLMELVNNKNEYFLCDKKGVPLQPLQVSAEYKDKDFNDWRNDAEKFDNALKELLEACFEAEKKK